MTEILACTALNGEVYRLDLLSPDIAAEALPGQFVMLRVCEGGERIPLTVAKAEDGVVTVIVQRVGKTTWQLTEKKAGESVAGITGPLGKPTPLDGLGNVCVVGGGLGCAIAWPLVRGLKRAGAEARMIAGFRNKALVILEDELRRDASELYICTDDGSRGERGFVTDKLSALLQSGRAFDRIFAAGPLVMMKAVCAVAPDIPVTVSMNPIMVDGTGMCGCCRVNVGGQVRFACVDGPDFDGHAVDFDEAIRRNRTYLTFEEKQLEEHICKLP
ncbi:MAG: sulfide/dihydroorotate dehydrogenase-like FAD/NAD-binding protein [Oscillospiraceae bacterium]|nr:sulfide/dihydroorotate dehydrogenase-like FAD/NAD-binding protein [Oscillospiraceae bacterium]